jgi:hypothetical protein
MPNTNYLLHMHSDFTTFPEYTVSYWTNKAKFLPKLAWKFKCTLNLNLRRAVFS